MGKCFNFNFTCFLKLLRGIIYVLILFDAWLILYKTNQIICAGTDWMDMFIKWENLTFFLKAVFGLVTLYVASKQLRKQSDMGCIQALVELRKQLTTGHNRMVHFALSPKEDKETLNGDIDMCNLKKQRDIPMIDVFNYLGTIGLGIQMVRQDLISRDIFYSHFSYRIENIFTGDSEIHKKVQKHIDDCEQYYKNLLWMKEQIRKRKFEI
jgi:hypothetical protein